MHIAHTLDFFCYIGFAQMDNHEVIQAMQVVRDFTAFFHIQRNGQFGDHGFHAAAENRRADPCPDQVEPLSDSVRPGRAGRRLRRLSR